jgi:hypothetical protein
MARDPFQSPSGPMNMGGRRVPFVMPGIPNPTGTGASGSSSAMDGSDAWASDGDSSVVDTVSVADSMGPRWSETVNAGDSAQPGQYPTGPSGMPITNSTLGGTTAGQAGADDGYGSQHVCGPSHPDAALGYRGTGAAVSRHDAMPPSSVNEV